jgi:hypothetical protein
MLIILFSRIAGGDANLLFCLAPYLRCNVRQQIRKWGELYLSFAGNVNATQGLSGRSGFSLACRLKARA